MCTPFTAMVTNIGRFSLSFSLRVARCSDSLPVNMLVVAVASSVAHHIGALTFVAKATGRSDFVSVSG